MGGSVVVEVVEVFDLINLTRFSSGLSKESSDFSTTASAKRFSTFPVVLASSRSCSTDWDWT